jgi:hypothetical protein
MLARHRRISSASEAHFTGRILAYANVRLIQNPPARLTNGNNLNFHRPVQSVLPFRRQPWSSLDGENHASRVPPPVCPWATFFATSFYNSHSANAASASIQATRIDWQISRPSHHKARKTTEKLLEIIYIFLVSM